MYEISDWPKANLTQFQIVNLEPLNQCLLSKVKLTFYLTISKQTWHRDVGLCLYTKSKQTKNTLPLQKHTAHVLRVHDTLYLTIYFFKWSKVHTWLIFIVQSQLCVAVMLDSGRACYLCLHIYITTTFFWQTLLKSWIYYNSTLQMKTNSTGSIGENVSSTFHQWKQFWHNHVWINPIPSTTRGSIEIGHQCLCTFSLT